MYLLLKVVSPFHVFYLSLLLTRVGCPQVFC